MIRIVASVNSVYIDGHQYYAALDIGPDKDNLHVKIPNKAIVDFAKALADGNDIHITIDIMPVKT